MQDRRQSMRKLIGRQANKVGLAFHVMITDAPESDLDARLRRSQKRQRELQRRIRKLLSNG